MSLKTEQRVEAETIYNVRIRALDEKFNPIDLDTIEPEILSGKLQSLTVCITPYQIKNNIIKYYNYKNVENEIIIPMSDDVEMMVSPIYNTEEFLFKKDYLTLESFFTEFKFNMSRKAYENSVDLELYVDFNSSLPFFFDKEFTTFLFQYFNGNIVLYGNSNTTWEMPAGEISVNSIYIERGTLRLNSIVNFRCRFFELLHLSIVGNGLDFQALDQLVMYSKESSSLKYCTLDNPIQIGISCEMESQYSWQETVLELFTIDINFSTASDKMTKYEHIFKLDNYAAVNLTNIAINQKLTKMVPFKTERCPVINILNYTDYYRPKDKGTVELSLTKVSELNVNNFTVLAEGVNEKETPTIAIMDVEGGDTCSFNNVTVKNVNFLSLSNAEFLSIDIDNTIIDSNQSVFHMGGELYIDEININNTNIISNSFSMTDLKSLYFYKSYIKSKNDLNIHAALITLSDTEFVGMKDINLKSTGFDINEEIAGKVSFKDSGITATQNLNVTTDRQNGNSIVDNTKIKAKVYTDSGFVTGAIKDSELIVHEFIGESEEYQVTDATFNNKSISKFEKAYHFKGSLQGSATIKNEDSNTKMSICIEKETMNSDDRQNLELTINSNDTGNNLDLRMDFIKTCQSVLYKTIGNENVKVDIYIDDDSKIFYTTGVYQYKNNDSKNLNLYLKNTSVEDMVNVLTNDGTLEEDGEKLNFGIQPTE